MTLLDPPRRKARGTLLLIAVAALLLLARPPLVLAHAILVRSTPAAHAVIDGTQVDVELHFNSRIDAARSLLVLVLPDGKTQQLTILKSASLEALLAHAANLPPGPCTLRWQVLANDGHISRGEIPFTVSKR